MKDLFNIDFSEIFNAQVAQTAIRIAIIVVLGFLVVKILALIMGRVVKKRLSLQSSMLVRKAIFYAGAVIILLAVLQQLGVELTALLGAAGIVGIAVGFAAQTSMSNLISGLFLISEKPFAIGDVIRAGGTMGVVLSIDLLSVKIRTFDNQFVRVPNEKILNTEVVNATRFPIRRLDIKIGVACNSDVTQLRDTLLNIAASNPYCLDEPRSLVIFNSFGESTLDFLFAVWCEKSDFLTLKNSIMQEIKERFERENIEMPFPHRAIYTGTGTEPFPVTILDPSVGSKSGGGSGKKRNSQRS